VIIDGLERRKFGACDDEHGSYRSCVDAQDSRDALGVDAFVGAVTWLDVHTLLVAGEHGLVARMHVD